MVTRKEGREVADSKAWGPAEDAPPEVESDSAPGETAPKRRGRPPGSRNSGRTPGRPKASLAEPIAGMLWSANLPLSMIAPNHALDQAELIALATGLNEQAQASPRFYRIIKNALGVASASQLIAVVGMIGARHAARIGFLPAEVDDLMGSNLSSMTKEPHRTPEYAPREPVSETMQHTTQDNGTGEMPAVGATHIAEGAPGWTPPIG